MSELKKFRWMSFPGLLVMLVGCVLITGDDDDDDAPVAPLYVKSAILNIRAERSLNASVVGKANRGTLIVPLKHVGQWYGVELTDGTIGWVHSDYVSPKR